MPPALRPALVHDWKSVPMLGKDFNNRTANGYLCRVGVGGRGNEKDSHTIALTAAEPHSIRTIQSFLAVLRSLNMEGMAYATLHV